jgi:hypothetical protein
MVVAMLWPKIIEYKDIHILAIGGGRFFSRKVSINFANGLFEGGFSFYPKEPEKVFQILKDHCPSLQQATHN